MIEIHTVGGFGEIGRNMTLIKYRNEAIVIDLGLHLDNYIEYTQDEEIEKIDPEELIKVGAVPNINKIKVLLPYVNAIVISHAHLDHLGAALFLSNKFKNAKIIGSPYTISVLKELAKDDDIKINNKLVSLSVNGKYRISKYFTINFIPIGHSTPNTVVIVLETPEGNIAYANDFKMDFNPIIGNIPNIKRLEKFKGINLLIMDSLYADRLGKTPSEAVAREMLKDVLLGTKNDLNAIFITTFSSHIARLKSIVDISKKMNREVIFIGRSLCKYIYAAENIKLIKFSDKYKMIKYSSKLKSILRKIKKDPKRYVVVVTGHQGEPNSILAKIVFKDLYNFKSNDIVIFSSNVIPQEPNISNRKKIELELENKNVRVFRDVHVSGHASREDHRDLIRLLNPRYIIPAHCEIEKSYIMKDFVEKNFDSRVIIAKEGDAITI